MKSAQIPGTTQLGGLAPDEIQKQLSSIIHSKAFRHASALQRLLQYLVTKSIEDPFGDVKEYTIGTEVFDRGAGYDPQSDTIVRVQVHRLRLKVKECRKRPMFREPLRKLRGRPVKAGGQNVRWLRLVLWALTPRERRDC